MGGPDRAAANAWAGLDLQISHEFERFSSYMPDLNVQVIYGGVDLQAQKAQLKAKPPHIVVGTPGRVKSVRARCTSSRDEGGAVAAAVARS